MNYSCIIMHKYELSTYSMWAPCWGWGNKEASRNSSSIRENIYMLVGIVIQLL